ncbi:UNVERIFIED_CONTAM: hypothetical protein FKN15_073012 [Acipenser sinensis]
MDPALLRERELFKKRALSTPAVEKRAAPSESSSSKKKKPKLDQGGSTGCKQASVTRSRAVAQASINPDITFTPAFTENCNTPLALFHCH